jgi:ppGpp synthetase/RelA/SpoT-type nucleotidyltranferase
VDHLRGKYEENHHPIKAWLDEVRAVINGWMEEPFSRVHSVRARMKHPSHLDDKIGRKWDKTDDDSKRWKAKPLKQKLDEFFEDFQDLAGARILTLYRADILIVDGLVRDHAGWRLVGRPIARYDEKRTGDRDWFGGHGFKTHADENGYASVHYILQRAGRGALACEVCELQVRTIHEEAWGEFSHELKYPHEVLDRLASDLITELSGLLHLAEDFVADIRRDPADASIIRQLLAEGKDPAKRSAVKTLVGFMERAPYLYRAAPCAAVRLLAGGKPLKASLVVSLDFESPRKWAAAMEDGDPIRNLYLGAHEVWANKNRLREYRKFFRLSESDTTPLAVKAGRQLTRLHKRGKFFGIPHDVFKCVHKALAKRLKHKLLERTQFFLWDPDSNVITKSVSFLETNVYGFYGFSGPLDKSDLLGSVGWFLRDCDRRYQDVLGYARLLNRLADEEIIPRLPRTTPKIKTWKPGIQKAVAEIFPTR